MQVRSKCLFEADSWFINDIFFYVDELLITGSSKDEIASLKGAMNHAFLMTDLGLLSQFLELDIAQTKDGIKVHQSKYSLDFSEQIQHEGLQANQDSFPFRS